MESEGGVTDEREDQGSKSPRISGAPSQKLDLLNRSRRKASLAAKRMNGAGKRPLHLSIWGKRPVATLLWYCLTAWCGCQSWAPVVCSGLDATVSQQGVAAPGGPKGEGAVQYEWDALEPCHIQKSSLPALAFQRLDPFGITNEHHQVLPVGSRWQQQYRCCGIYNLGRQSDRIGSQEMAHAHHSHAP